MKLERIVQVEYPEDDRILTGTTEVIIDDPVQDEDGWCCPWFCPFFHDEPRRLIFGHDPMEAYYLCLNGIGVFLKEMQKHGVHITWMRKGDNGGFDWPA